MVSAKEKLSIVIPCYNEENSLNILFPKLDSIENIINADYNSEIIFINDGSTDRTHEELSKKYAGRSDIILISYKNNKGYGYALKEGLKRTTGDLIVTIDADTNYDQREIPNILSIMKDGFDVITASPFSHQGKWSYPGLRFVLSWSLSRIYSLILKGKGKGVSTYTSCFRVYRKRILSDILPESDDFVANAEMLIRALIKGYRIREYPTRVYRRKSGRSKMKIGRTVISHVRFISKIINRKI